MFALYLFMGFLVSGYLGYKYDLWNKLVKDVDFQVSDMFFASVAVVLAAFVWPVFLGYYLAHNGIFGLENKIKEKLKANENGEAKKE